MSLSIFAAARAAPDREALVCGAERLDFQTLARRVAFRIGELGRWGVRAAATQPVALVADGTVTAFEFLYALLALGVPVLPLHPRLTPPERAFLLEAAAVDLLLEPTATEPSAPARLTAPGPLPIIPDSNALAIIATSGSSGVPKLVELSRGAFIALAAGDAARIAAQAHDRALLCLPLSHVGGLSVIVRALVARRTCVVFDAKGSLLQAIPELDQVLERERISLLSLVPPVLSRLLREAPDFADRAPLRAVLVGGQACSPELFSLARERRVPILTSYGLTEACSQVTTLAYPPPTHVGVQNGLVSSGFPLPGVELRVRDGLVEVRGSTLFTRYLRSASALNEEGFFPTGDRADFDPELGLFVRGRQSELIVTGGENVDPVEVEHAILASAAVNAVCVFGIRDAEFGQRVAAAIELTAGQTLDEQRLLLALDEHLASFKQPRALCVCAALPRLASGKLDRAAIARSLAARMRPVKR